MSPDELAVEFVHLASKGLEVDGLHGIGALVGGGKGLAQHAG